MNYRELNRMLLGRINDVCNHLIPNGQKKGNKWHFGDLEGGTGQSSSVVLSGSSEGSWADWSTGEKGNNLVSLWCRTRCGGDFPKAMDEIKDYLNVKDEFKLHATKREYSRPSAAEKSKVKAIDKRGRVIKYLQDDRGLHEKTISNFKVCASEDDTKYIFPYYDEDGVVMFKSVALDREDGKKAMFSTRDAKPVLFGKPTVPPTASYVIICEGEIDSMSWHQYGHPAVSIPQGAKNMNWVENDWDWLERFETIYLNFDSDEVGRAGAKELCERLGPERCMNVALEPYKDGNEMLTDDEDAPERFLASAKAMMPEEIESFSDGWDDVVHELTTAIDNPDGVKVPWEGLKLRIRPREVTAVVGFTGHGKSTVINQLAVHLQANGWPGIIASLEGEVAGLKADLVRTVCGSYSLTMDQINRSKDSSIFKDLFIVNRKQDRQMTAEKIYEYFRMCSRKYGCKYAVLDNMMMCDIKSDDLDAQKNFVEQLNRLANDTGMHIFLIVHPRKPPSEKELARPPSIYETKGAGEIVNLIHNFLSVWRNVPKHMKVAALKRDQKENGTYNEALVSEQAKPDGSIEVQKQRRGHGDERGWVGGVKTWVRGRCQMVTDDDAKPINYLDESDLEAMSE